MARNRRRLSTSGWIDGEVDIHENLPSELRDDSYIWDPYSAFPTRFRFATCAVLFLIGTTCFMYKNMLSTQAREDTMLIQIKNSIAEMEEITATVSKMEIHAQRLASMTKSHLEALTLKAGTKKLVSKHEQIRAEVESIHADTMKHMEEMMQTMVDTTRQEVVDMATAFLAVQQSSAIISPVGETSSSVLVSPGQESSQNISTVIPTPPKVPVQSVQPIAQTIPIPSTNTSTVKPTNPDRATQFWIFTVVGTILITGVIVYLMQQRASFRRDRLAFQKGTRQVNAILALWQQYFFRATRWGRRVFALSKEWCLGLWYGDQIDVEDISEDEISFFPQTPMMQPPQPRPDMEHEEDDEYEEVLPQKHITFTDVESDDGDDIEIIMPEEVTRSNMVRTEDYRSFLTPTDFQEMPRQKFGAVENPNGQRRRRSPRLADRFSEFA
ncbi:hypothetical protein AeMF1_004976 [Aphanomyces euteiches]|nr:hypothetical protein AeMF1_004976 [Aphanomyces euteiches]KAH9185955.1 hypothetical protein AeNC1_012065 [Aphanomyces euteiches]